jgi:hypothetical protein
MQLKKQQNYNMPVDANRIFPQFFAKKWEPKRRNTRREVA